MTVRELMEHLRSLDPALTVVVADRDYESGMGEYKLEPPFKVMRLYAKPEGTVMGPFSAPFEDDPETAACFGYTVPVDAVLFE